MAAVRGIAPVPSSSTGRRAAPSAPASTEAPASDRKRPLRQGARRCPQGRRCRRWSASAAVLVREAAVLVREAAVLVREAAVHVRDDRAGGRRQRRPHDPRGRLAGPPPADGDRCLGDRPAQRHLVDPLVADPPGVGGRDGTVSAITTTGSRSRAAWAMPLTALASPGPRVTTTDPGVPVRSAQVAAMIVAAVSPWARTKRIPAAAAAPTTSRFGPPPGTPNISRVPALASAPTIASAAGIASVQAVLASNEAPL